MRNSVLFIAFACLLILAGCKKENIGPADCKRLQNGIVAADKEQVKEIINNLISILPSKTHTAQNLNKLAAAIRQQCGVAAEVLCFACIDTYPGQSEIRITCTTPDGNVERTVDISTPSPTNDEMIFRSMHY